MTDAKTLDREIERLASVPVLLVASDYDGTLAAIVDDPSEAAPDREAMLALSGLADLPNTRVAVISGRALSDLANLTGEPRDIHLVGSHGSEFEPDFGRTLGPERVERRDRIGGELDAIAADYPGATVERKPASVALHYRRADEGRHEEIERRALETGAARDGAQTKRGKKVIEFSVVPTDKGEALATLRGRVGASAVLFLGDDVTDEDAFARLSGPDVGVKIGLEGETAAGFRVEGQAEVARLLARLCEARRTWLSGDAAAPIEQHALLSDQRTAALVTPDARVVWMCAPRIDSGSLFAELLGGPAAGRFSIRPLDAGAPIEQSYLGDTMILRTAWPKITVTDYLDVSANRASRRAGRSDLIRVIEGSGRVRIAFAPRLDYGRTPTRLSADADGLRVEDTPDPIVLRAPCPSECWSLTDEGPHQTAVAVLDLSDLGGRLPLELRFGTGDLAPAPLPEPTRRHQSDVFWSSWAQRLRPPAVHAELVRRSAITLRALCHGPTGAIAAAATTSLPECLGGVRNWDYRYCWPRDAAMSGSALTRVGSNDEGLRLLDWVLGVVDRLESPDRLRPIYTVSGSDLPAEAEIPELHGYAGSRPVRISNAASGQVQLDVFGPILELMWLLLEDGAPLSSEHMRLVEALTTAVSMRWRDPDHGIWEFRGPREHHVHTKVMCWQTVRLAERIHQRLRGRPHHDWRTLADDIAADILERGWDEAAGAFLGAYEQGYPDASVLTVGLAGLVEPDDPRWLATVRFVERELREGPTVYRYRKDDGLPGCEGGFNLCTAWLIEAYALCGREQDARSLLDDYAELVGGTGLLSEEFEPDGRIALGNHPQAYSHLGLINAAVRLDRNGAG